MPASDTSITVESCLAELREMFPDQQVINIQIRDYPKAREFFINVDFTFQGVTLAEAMRQVRAWKESQ